MISVYQQSFSWSVSRDRLFKSCPRAYFFHYYLAQGGHDPFSPPEIRHAYLLKNLKTADSWTEELFSRAVRDTFLNLSAPATATMALKNITAHLRRRFTGGRRECLSGEWREDPKKLNLFELYYHIHAPDTVFDTIRNNLEEAIKKFSSSNIFTSLPAAGPLQFLRLPLPVSFFLEGLEIWLSPTLIWREERLLQILFMSTVEPLTVSLLSGMLRQKTGIAGESKITFFTADTGCQAGPPPFSRMEMIRQVKTSAAEMQTKLSPAGNATPENFPPVANHCRQCRFSQLCESYGKK